jgi:hypothetical protein
VVEEDPKPEEPNAGVEAACPNGLAAWPNPPVVVDGEDPNAGVGPLVDPKAGVDVLDPNAPVGFAPKPDWPNADPPVPAPEPNAEDPNAGVAAAPPKPDEAVGLAPNADVGADDAPNAGAGVEVDPKAGVDDF